MDTDGLRALVTTLETLITEASRVTGELKAAIASAEAISAPGRAVVASSAVTVSPDHAVPVGNRLHSGVQAGASAAVRAPASTPWARKRAATSAVVRPAPPGTAAAMGLPASPAEPVTRTGMPAAARPAPVAGPIPVASSAAASSATGAARSASPSSPVVAEPATRQAAPHPIDSSPRPVPAAETVDLSRETQPPPALAGTGDTPTVSVEQAADSAPQGPLEAVIDTRAAATDSSVAAANTDARVLLERPAPAEPAACSSSGPVREPVAPHAEPVLTPERAEVSAPPDRAQLPAGPAERPRMAAHSETARPPAPEPRPAPRTIELPPELSLQLARITVPPRARPVLRSEEPVRREVAAGPVRGEPVRSDVRGEPVRREIPAEAMGTEPPPGEMRTEEPRRRESPVGPVPGESPVGLVPAESPVGPVPGESPVGPVGPEPQVGPVRTDLPAEPETTPALRLVDDPSPPDTFAPPEPEPFAPPEVLSVVPGTGGNPVDAIRLAKDMARRHGLRIRGFETAGLETEVVHQIAAALNDLLGKYTVELYGIEVTEQRDDTIRRERKKAAESGSAEPPPVWITVERAELASPGAGGTGPTRRRFRRAGATDRPAYTAVVRAFAAALDEAGDYRARQEAWRILMAGSLSGGPDIGAGLLDPGRALVEGFVEVELHGKRAGEPAKELHRALLKMAQAESEESTA
ncbi:hypothetical protein ACIBEK_04765 [Nocardia fusca]|uniref:hypothetical protein n=1 Tax=Nocardia fusca TaxID=941183 RepID=UPI0037908E36